MKFLTAIIFVLFATAASAQEVVYAPPDQRLWVEMKNAFDDLPMSKSTHLKVDNLFATVEREARDRAEQVAKAKAKAKAKTEAETEKAPEK